MCRNGFYAFPVVFAAAGKLELSKLRLILKSHLFNFLPKM